MGGVLVCGRGHNTNFEGEWPEGRGCPECQKQDANNDALAKAIAREVAKEVEAILDKRSILSKTAASGDDCASSERP